MLGAGAGDVSNGNRVSHQRYRPGSREDDGGLRVGLRVQGPGDAGRRDEAGADGLCRAERYRSRGYAEAMLAAASSDVPAELACPYRYRAKLAPAAAAEADGAPLPHWTRIEQAYREIQSRSDVMLVEDCEGLAASLDWQHTYADLASACGLKMILVVANRASFINAAALALDYAERRGIRVAGFILNALDREASTSVAPDAEFLSRATRATCLGTVRFKEPLALSIVERLL
jgi:dethiobiotin synthase